MSVRMFQPCTVSVRMFQPCTMYCICQDVSAIYCVCQDETEWIMYLPDWQWTVEDEEVVFFFGVASQSIFFVQNRFYEILIIKYHLIFYFLNVDIQRKLLPQPYRGAKDQCLSTPDILAHFSSDKIGLQMANPHRLQMANPHRLQMANSCGDGLYNYKPLQ